ncbi:hypothetical protein [Halorubellus sp. PRR65]|uniref:hypothetical protein n=1 Tax=Halorubellus sp. PRR65 TaxID=3098148 RepID=UPI002B25E2E8|nr:hypothetical protein [Halorubellus sp. PRR65]
MNATLSSFSTEEASAVVVVATTVAAMAWFGTDLAGVSRLATTGLSFVVAAVSMLVGLHVLSRRRRARR